VKQRNDLLQLELGQRVVFLQTDKGCFEPVRSAYMQHKQQNHSMCALPLNARAVGSGLAEVAAMHTVDMQKFSPSDAVFGGLNGIPIAAPWDMHLWWNRPLKRRLCPTVHFPGQLAMQFQGSTITDRPVSVLMDTGVLNAFVSHSCCLQAGVPVTPVAGQQEARGTW
jgi:hypothetical protein